MLRRSLSNFRTTKVVISPERPRSLSRSYHLTSQCVRCTVKWRYCERTRSVHVVANANSLCKWTTGIQWIPFPMFETLNSCRRKLVCVKIMPNVGKNLSWCALLPNFKKNQKRKLVSSQIRLVHFPHLRGQLWGATTSQIHSLLSIFWHVALHNGVQ